MHPSASMTSQYNFIFLTFYQYACAFLHRGLDPVWTAYKQIESHFDGEESKKDMIGLQGTIR